MANSSAHATPTLRAIPSVDQLLRTETVAELRSSIGLQRLTAIARQVIEEIRQEIHSDDSSENMRHALLAEAAQRVQTFCKNESLSSLRRVINATGVILHTNLGRAPLSEAARLEIANEAAGYCTLEYDPRIA